MTSHLGAMPLEPCGRAGWRVVDPSSRNGCWGSSIGVIIWAAVPI